MSNAKRSEGGASASASSSPGAAAAEKLAEQIESSRRDQRRKRRLAIALGLLLAGLLASLYLRREPAPPPHVEAGEVFFIDTEGWYRRSPNEVAVASPFKLTLDALPDSLPMRLGAWQGEKRRPDPAIDAGFGSPDVVIERTYRRADGELIWFTALGSKGDKSFFLFEHTPNLCYPVSGWQIQSFETEGLPQVAGTRPLPVNRGVAQGDQGELVFLFFYVWESPARDPNRGVLSVRIAAPVSDTPEATFQMLSKDFLPQIFPRTLRWSRF